MNSLIPPLTSQTTPPVPDAGGVNGTLEIPSENAGELGSLKPGQTISLTIASGLEKYIGSVKLNINNQLFEIPVNLKLGQNLPLDPQQNYEVSARVVTAGTQNLQIKITAVNGQPPEKLLLNPDQIRSGEQTPAVIRPENLSVKPEVTLHNLPLSNIVEKLAGNNLPPEVKTALRTMLSGSEITVGFKNIGGQSSVNSLPPQTAEAVARLENLLQNALPAEKMPSPVQIAELAFQIKQTALALNGASLPGETFVRPEAGVTGFRTALGDIISSSPLKLENGLPVELLLQTADQRPQVMEGLQDLLRLLTQLPQEGSTVPNARSQPHVLQTILQPLTENHPDLAAAVAAKIPAQNANLLGNMVNYVKAAVSHDVKQWIGPEVMEKLALAGADGREALASIQNAFNLANRETPIWRIIEIPFFSGEHMEKIRLAIKKYNEEEDETPAEQKRKYGTRFVVDTNFTRLGRFQFDGYSLARDKRFDLIIRTEREVGNDLCANIMRIFKTTLSAVDYAGTVHINVKENFIKIGEDTIDDELLKQGLYI